MKTSLLSAALLCSTLSVAQAAPVDVDLELVLLTDVSGSVDNDDYNLMRDGYAAAFRSAALIAKIQEGAIGKIAVQVVQFSNAAGSPFAGWAIIEDAASAEAFATLLDTMARLSSGGTNIIAGLEDSVSQIFGNDINSTRQVIDLAGDGAQNDSGCVFTEAICVPLQDARDAALAAGVDTINALLIDDGDFFGDDAEDAINAIEYAQNNITGGDGNFAGIVDSFLDFDTAIEAKLIREIQPPMPPVPLPAAGWLMLAGLGTLAAMRRRRNA